MSAVARVAVEASRLVVVPSILGLDMGFAELRTSDVDRTYLVVLGALELLAIVLIIVRVAAWALADIRFRAERDYLTGLYNRGTFEYLALDSIRREPGVLILADLDHFKRVNDDYGHDAGDMALCFVAELLASRIRQTDVAGRLGGEEFGILLSDVDLVHARQIAEDLRDLIQDRAFRYRGKDIPLSASIGIAELGRDGMDFRTLFSKADRRLYQAKAEGRNRVVG